MVENHTPAASIPASPFRFVLLGASFSTGNLGVAALAAGTIAALAESRPGAQVSILDYNRTPVIYQVKTSKDTVSVPLVNLRFSKLPWLPNHILRLLLTACLLRLVPARKLRERIVHRNPCLKLVKEADMIGVLSGGDSFSDIYGLGRLIYVTLPQFLVWLLGQPMVLLPQTVGPFKGILARLIARFLLRRAQWIYSRDHAGLDEIRSLLGSRKSNLRFSYDVGFLLEPVRPMLGELAWLDEPSRQRPLVGLNVSGLLLMGGYTGRNMFGLKADYHSLVRYVIECFIREMNSDVLLVPHVLAHTAESDADACSKVHGELNQRCFGRLHIVRGTFDQHQTKYLIGRCDFFVGARMHACIAALSQGVPAVSLAYSRKFIGVMESLGIAGLVADLRTLSQNEVLGKLRETFAQRTQISLLLRQRMPEVRQTVIKVFSP